MKAKHIINRYLFICLIGFFSVTHTTAGKKNTVNSDPVKNVVPILSIDPIEGGICEVLTTFVTVSVELPNPEGLTEEYLWLFPPGTADENGNAIYFSTNRNPGKLKFGRVGSQTIRLFVKLGGYQLEEETINVPVACNEAVPTLYYAVKNGNIMALKLQENKPAGMKIDPYDMGISSGKRPLNILFNNASLYILDCGQQFTYTDDELYRNQGDGRIIVMAKDGSKVETMLTNARGYAFDDPYYGYIEEPYLYFSDRRTGFARIDLSYRNWGFDRSYFPFWVENNRLGYYNQIMSFASINACFGKINGLWFWCKTFNGLGIARFRDSDILPKSLGAGETAPQPADGWVLRNLEVKSFVWDDVRKVFYFTVYTTGMGGIYRCTITELNYITASTASLAPYKLTTANGKSIPPINEGGRDEGASGEYIGICQLALDEATGCVYFGYRSPNPDEMKSGLMRYNPAKGFIEYVIEGIEVYGVAINKNKSKLF